MTYMHTNRSQLLSFDLVDNFQVLKCLDLFAIVLQLDNSYKTMKCKAKEQIQQNKADHTCSPNSATESVTNECLFSNIQLEYSLYCK